MEWVKLLTQKLKNQSISEVTPVKSTDTVNHNTEMDDCDSGTESDGENAEICSITEGLVHNQENNQPQAVSPGAHLPCALTSTRSPTSPSHATTLVTRRPFRQVHPHNNQVADSNHHHHNHNPHTAATVYNVDINASISPCGPCAAATASPQLNKTVLMECAEMDRCGGLDTELKAGVVADFERHSSEEELTVINLKHVRQAAVVTPEKRKWSQVISVENGRTKNSNSSGHVTRQTSGRTGSRLGSSADSPASSDEEVKDVLFHSKPSKFSSTPPRGVQRLRRTISPRLFLANVSPTNNNSRSCWISPRKRQRQNSVGDSHSEATVMQRPCLDLEKMQKMSSSRKNHHHHHHHHHHGVSSRARIVKIKTFNGSGRPAKCILDPAVFSFRSISTFNQLTPVEEPCAF